MMRTSALALALIWLGLAQPAQAQNNAAFVSQTVPTAMTPGQIYAVSVTMQNTGSTTWTAAAGYKLGTDNPSDNNIWLAHRISVPNNVPPGQNVTFSFNVTAPTTPGVYNFQRKMLREGVEWFGALTVNVAVNVQPPPLGAKLHFIHVDHLNTPRLVANQQGQAVWRWEQQEPFGTSPADENPSGLGAFEFPLRFPGQYADKETNLYYNYFRDCYDPALGRYCQSDPIGLRGGINTYSYANGNAILYVDPEGLAVYGSAQGSGGGWGAGYVTVTCGNECNKIRRFHYLKICKGFAMRAASLSGGVVSNMNGTQCRPDTFAGYSFELGAGVGGFGAEAGFGLSGSYLPTGLSGVNTVGLGVAVPGWSALVCFYKFLGEW